MDEICGEQGDKKSAVTAIALQDEKISQEAKECLKSLYGLYRWLTKTISST